MRYLVTGVTGQLGYDVVRILKENSDGTILAKLPLKSLKLSIIEIEITDEQREEMRKKFKERMWGGEDK